MISIALEGTEGAPAIDPAAEKMGSAFGATVSTKIRGWAYLPDPERGERPFSIRQLIEDEAAMPGYRPS